MLQNRRRVAAGCWAVAGLPILASFVQATVALFETTATTIPLIGSLTQFLWSVSVFRTAGNIFRSSSTIVFILFVLIALAWIAQGIGLFALQHRVMTLGATGFVTLFLVLFELVYLPIASAGIPAIQTAGFLFVPIGTAAMSWAASLVFDWNVTLDSEAAEALSTARESTQQALTTFDDQIERVVDEQVRSSLRTVAPEAVAAFESECSEFRERCQTVQDKADAVVDGSISSRERHDTAAQLQADAAKLNDVAEETAVRLISTLKRRLRDEIKEQYSDVHYVSRFNREYKIRNLRTHNSVSPPTIDGPAIQIGGAQHEIATRLIETIETNPDGLAAVAGAVDAIDTHLEAVEETLQTHEEPIAESLDTAENAIETTATNLNKLEGPAQERLEAYLLEGRTPKLSANESLPTKPIVDDHRKEALEALHECRFDAATQSADTAETEAKEMVQIAEFFGQSVTATIEYGSGSIPVPSSIDTDLVEKLRVPFERSYQIEYQVVDDVLNLTERSDSETESGAGNATSGVTGAERSRTADGTGEHAALTGGTPRDTEVPQDDVLYVLGELQASAASQRGKNTVELQTERLPAKFIKPAVLTEIKSFAERQGDVVQVTIPSNPPPGFLSIEVADGVSPRRVMKQLQSAYA
jgi:hypothetical protein